MKIKSLPLKIINTLNSRGFEAYVVGGCVRDFLLSNPVHDYDICTSALPEEICSCFKNVVMQGVRFGTVLVLENGEGVEVTTFRTESDYKDNRRPETVNFVKSLEQDLSRRDFTVNAMAYHPDKGITDLFGGKQDIENKIIRCVGDADLRFREDALRIIRAMRFASLLGFSIEENTKKAMLSNKNLLKSIAKERITEEFIKLLGGIFASEIILEFSEIINLFIENFTLPDNDFESLPQNPYMRFAFLIHNLENKEAILKNFRLPCAISQKILILANHYKKDNSPFTLLQKYNEDVVFEVFEMNNEIETLTLFLKENPCYKISQLAISGNDLKEIGFFGKKIKEVQNELLYNVVFKKIKNDKISLLEFAKKLQ